MRILALHCDEFAYAAVHASAGASEIKPASGGNEMFGSCLLLLISVEPGDEQKVRAAAKSIRRLARRLKSGTLVLNGFAHLSENLASLDTSKEVLRCLEQAVSSVDWQVYSTPFGWHKRFSLQIRADADSQKFLHV